MRTAIITGVSSGIGRTTAELMARSGWQVIATSRSPETNVDWAAANNLCILPMILAEEGSIQNVVGEVVNRYGRIDALVNNAGFGLFGPFEGMTGGELASYFETNFLGALALIRHVMPIMRAQRDGVIVNVSSIGGRTAAPFASLYHAAKFALEGFSESFRYEAALHGVRVKLVEPAHFKTNFLSKSLRTATHPEYDANFDNYMQWVRRKMQRLLSRRPSPARL